MPIAPKLLLNDLTIAIPSSGRASRQITLEQLPDSVLGFTHLVIPSAEEKAYSVWKDRANLWLIPDEIKGISQTRKYMVENCKTRYIAMIDDDMSYFRRDDMSSPKLKKIEARSQEMMDLLVFWYGLLMKYVHVGLSARQGNNRESREVVECRRMFNAYMYDKDTVLKAGVILGRLPVMEDFDLTLQLLKKGYPNAMIYKWCWNQGASNLPGGCSQYRTNQMQEEAAIKLAELHPGYVKLVKKQSRNWIGMETRTDVTIYWNKAYANSNGESKRAE